jgi:diacylglycerol kinase (ATP)
MVGDRLRSFAFAIVRALLIVNPQSRRGGALGDAVRRELVALGVQFVEEHDDRIDAVVVAGGDGTFARAIPFALEHNVPMGIVPLGTFNDLARTLRIPFEISQACDVIARGRLRAIDVARVNGAYYVTEASIGLSSRIARLQTTADKQRFGFFAVVASAFGALRHVRPFRAVVSYDGKHVNMRAIQLTVANSNRFGGLITVEDAAIDDGWLDLYTIEIERTRQIFSVVGAVLAHKRRADGVRTYRAKAFTVRTRHPHRITADGEPAGTTPARFELLPGILRVLTPWA